MAGKQSKYDVFLSFDSGPDGVTSQRVSKVAAALTERGLRVTCFAEAAKPGGAKCLTTAAMHALIEQSQRVLVFVTPRYADRLGVPTTRCGTRASHPPQPGGARQDRCAMELQFARRHCPGALVFAVLDPSMSDTKAWSEPLRSAVGSQPVISLSPASMASATPVDALIAAMLRASPAHYTHAASKFSLRSVSIGKPPTFTTAANRCHQLDATPATKPATGSATDLENKKFIISHEADAFLREVCKVSSENIQALEKQGVRSMGNLLAVTREVLLVAGFTDTDVVSFENQRSSLLPTQSPDQKHTASATAGTSVSSSSHMTTCRHDFGDSAVTSAATTKVPRLTEVSSLKEAGEVLRRCSEYHLDDLSKVCGLIEDVTRGCAYSKVEAWRLGLLSDLRTVLRTRCASDSTLTAHACAAIRTLCEKDDNQTEAGRLGLLADLQDVLRTYGISDVTVAQQACGAVWNICVDDENKAEAGKLKIVVELQSVLRTHGLTNVEVAEQACGALRNICILKANRQDAGQLGLLRELSAVLRRHGAAHSGLAQRVCGAVWNICSQDEEYPCSSLRSEAKALGLVAELQRVRRAHTANKEVQRFSKGAEATILGRSIMPRALP